jgi:parallel beta-helix repeat protein
MEVTLNGIVQKPVVFSSTATTWTCPVTNISSGNNDVVVYARNSGAESSGYAFATLLRVAPETLYVPKEYGTIQAAINASDNGDTVQVSPGTYYENINFKGKHIRVIKAPGKARAVIDGQGIGSVVTFNTGETPFSVLNGFMLTNGSAESGAGIYCGENTGPIITNNTITGNTASSTGGGIYVGKASTPAIIHNTLNANAAVQGGGVYCDITSAPHIENNIITNSSDNAYEIWVTSGAVPAHDYNTIWNTTAQYISGAPLGDHSISENPQFILNDYRLVETSPCIDMGNTMTLYLPDTDQDGQPRNSDGDGDGTPGVDMGAYEHTPGDLCQGNLEGSDSDVDGLEIAIFTRDFGRTDCSPTLPCAADLNQDGQVDEVDLGLFVKDFGQVSCP